MTQAPATTVRSHADAQAYLRSLAAAPVPRSPKHAASVRELNDFARHWEQEPPDGLEICDLPSLAWYHQEPKAFEVWSAQTSPSVHLLLVMSLQSSSNAAMFQAWPMIRSGLLSASLAPWRNCLLGMAIGCKHFPSARELLNTVAVDAPLPARGPDVQHWLWCDKHGADPRMDYTRPLHHALRSEDFQTAQWLLEHGADPWTQDSDQRNALHALDDHIEQSESIRKIMGRPGDKPELTLWRDRLFSIMQGEVLDLGTPDDLPDSEPVRRF